jgi:hypothetical protein
LSHYSLSSHESEFLNKGPSFRLPPTIIKPTVINDSLSSYFNQVKMNYVFPFSLRVHRFDKRQFVKHNSSTNIDINRMPCHILSFIEDCKLSFISSSMYCKERFYLSDFRAVQTLKGNRDIIVLKADKGATSVIMNKTDYLFEANRHLNNTKFYAPINHFNFTVTTKLRTILDFLYRNKYITKGQHHFLYNNDTFKDRQFYMLPKIHKNKIDWHTGPNNILVPPCRPIISDVDSLTYNISKYVNSFLLPIVKNTFSYIIDTDDFIIKLTNLNLPKTCHIFTLDVSSLYTNIPNDKGIEVVKTFFNQFPTLHRHDDSIIELMSICLHNHEFLFNGRRYIQTWGTAMGTPFAPNYANLYLSNWESIALSSYFKTPYFWVRYIDDIFGIWLHSKDCFKEFVTHLNSIDTNILVTSSISDLSIDYLDLTVYKGSNFCLSNTLDFKNYFKPTDNRTLIHSNSNHPISVKQSTIIGQITRYLKHSNNMHQFDNDCSSLFKILNCQGYSRSFLRNCKKRVLCRALSNSSITNYNFCGFFPCNRSNCVCKTYGIFSNVAIGIGRDYRIFHSINCDTTDCIYIIHCISCGPIYIGETSQSCRTRISSHLSTIRCRYETAVSLHFNSPRHNISDFRFQCIYHVNRNNTNIRRDKEVDFINRLKTFQPFGLNNRTFYRNQKPTVYLPYCQFTSKLYSKLANSCKTHGIEKPNICYQRS